MKTKIYKLVDPLTKKVMYVGKTSKTLEARLIGHLHESYNTERIIKDKEKWLKKLFKKGLLPKIQIIEYVDKNQESIRESYWITYYHSESPLFNLTFNKNKKYFKYKSLIKAFVIYQFDKDGNFIKKWKSITEAAKKLNIDGSNISYSASGKRKLAGKWMWRYEENIEICNNQILNIFPYIKNVTNKKVYQYTLNGEFVKEYFSARELEKEGFSYKNISQVCHNEKKSHKGFRFSFNKVDKLDPLSKHALKIINLRLK